MGQRTGTFFFDFVFNSDPRDEDVAKSLSLYQTDSGRYLSSQQYHSGTRRWARKTEKTALKVMFLASEQIDDIVVCR